MGATGKAGEVTRDPWRRRAQGPRGRRPRARRRREAGRRRVRAPRGGRRRAQPGRHAQDRAGPAAGRRRGPAHGVHRRAHERLRLRLLPQRVEEGPQGARCTPITVLLPAAPTPEQKQAVKEVAAVASAVNLTRDLVNTPPNALHPSVLAAAAVLAVDGLPVDVTIWDELDLVRDGCGGILAVGQGSANAPRLTRLQYAPEGATRHLALVGKGITFDTGGISIKPAANMDEMKSDMAGAAAVIGAVKAIAELALPDPRDRLGPVRREHAERHRPAPRRRHHDLRRQDRRGPQHRRRGPPRSWPTPSGWPPRTSPTSSSTSPPSPARPWSPSASRTAGVMANDDDARTAVCDAADAAGEADVADAAARRPARQRWTRAPPTSPTSATARAACCPPASSCASSSPRASRGCTSTSPGPSFNEKARLRLHAQGRHGQRRAHVRADRRGDGGRRRLTPTSGAVHRIPAEVEG